VIAHPGSRRMGEPEYSCRGHQSAKGTQASSAVSQFYDHTCNLLRHVSTFVNTICPAGPRREHPIFGQVCNFARPYVAIRTNSTTNEHQAVMNCPFRQHTPGHNHPGQRSTVYILLNPPQMNVSTSCHTNHLSCVGTRRCDLHQVYKRFLPRDGEKPVYKRSTFVLYRNPLRF